MAPNRRSAMGRLALMGCGAMAVWRLQLTPSAFFAPPTPPAGQVQTGGAVETPATAQSLQTVEKTSKNKALRDAEHHLKILLSPTALKPYLGRRVDDLERETGTLVQTARIGEYYPFSVDPLKPLIISGDSKAAVLDAVKRLTQGMSPIRMTFVVPKSVKGQLIGHGGDKITELRARSGAQIRVALSGYETTVEVTADSSESALAVAEFILDEEAEFVDDMRQSLTTNYIGSDVRGMKNECVVYVPMTDRQVSLMIGKGGENVKRIRSEFFVRIETQKEERDKQGNPIVKISGAIGDVQACHLYIFNRFANQPDAPPKEA